MLMELIKKKDGTLQRWSLVQLAPENKTGDKRLRDSGCQSVTADT